MSYRKYKAKRTTLTCPYSKNVYTFDSIVESKRYLELKLLEKVKVIKDLEIQPKYPYFFNNKKVFTYIADFKYKDQDGNEIIEDVKGVKTPVYRLKKKLIEPYCNIKITEVYM